MAELREGPLTTNDLVGIQDELLKGSADEGASSIKISATGKLKASRPEDSEVGIDVQSWVPNPSGVSPLGLAGGLVEAIINLCIPITQQISQPKYSKRLRGEIERLFLWGNCFSASQGHLDEVLAKSTELRQAVLRALYELGTVIKDDLLEFAHRYSMSQTQGYLSEVSPISLSLKRATQELWSLLDKAATVLDDTEVMAGTGSVSDDELTRYDLEGILEDMAIYIDCLMDLSPALDSPAIDPEPSNETYQRIENFEVSSSEAVAFCRRIRDRFPKMEKFLVERLGEANAARAIRLQDLQLGALKEVRHSCQLNDPSYDPHRKIEPTFSGPLQAPQMREFEVVGHRLEVTNSSYASHWKSERIFSESQPRMTNTTRTWSSRQSDSVSTIASFSTSYYITKEGRPRVPPLPEEAVNGGSFLCLACHQTLSGISTRAAWKKHIFADLLPYVCTAQSCTEATEMFKSRQEWSVHESTHREKALPSPSCKFCASEKIFSDSAKYQRHIAEHMREISLAVLPKSQEGDEGDSDHQAGDGSTRDSKVTQVSEEPAADAQYIENHPSQDPDISLQFAKSTSDGVLGSESVSSRGGLLGGESSTPGGGERIRRELPPTSDGPNAAGKLLAYSESLAPKNMADPISAAAAGTEAIKLCLELVRRVSTAIDLQKTGNSKLEAISDDLKSVRDVVKLVDAQEQLKTKGVLKEVTNIRKITMNVDKHVERVKRNSTTGSKARRITHQFMNGPGEWEILRAMMINLTAAKATLSLYIQFAHVGLMAAQGHGKLNVVNINILRDTNQNVEKFLGRGKGLVIAEVFKDKQPDANGMIYLTSEECDALPFAEIDPRSGQSGTLEVLNNRTFDQALQINGLVGEKVWGKFTSDLIIENNEARCFNTQINVPIKDKTYDDALQNRLELARIIAAAGAGGSMAQPLPYGQMGYYPVPPPMPGAQWYGQQQNPRTYPIAPLGQGDQQPNSWTHPIAPLGQGETKQEDIP